MKTRQRGKCAPHESPFKCAFAAFSFFLFYYLFPFSFFPVTRDCAEPLGRVKAVARVQSAPCLATMRTTRCRARVRQKQTRVRELSCYVAATTRGRSFIPTSNLSAFFFPSVAKSSSKINEKNGKTNTGRKKVCKRSSISSP